MSDYLRKYVKAAHFPVHPSKIKFRTNFTNCIAEALVNRQFVASETDDDWDIYWCEKEQVAEMLDRSRAYPNRRINHFRNYYELCRKDLLARNVKKHRRQLQKEGKAEEAAEFGFLPLTFNLPSELPLFLEEFKRNRDQKAVWIMKPIGLSQGQGVFLFNNLNRISNYTTSDANPHIVQRYIMNPLLIGHKKFDLRLYVLVTSHLPLVAYLYRSGFGRFTHSRYDLTDIDNSETHLTNVAIQKHCNNYYEKLGGKYLLHDLRIYMISKFGLKATNECFNEIRNVIVNTLLSVSKVMLNDKKCFNVYGFDVMIDGALKPWLIQVNGSPSMTANTPQDRKLKLGLLDDAFTIINAEQMLAGQEKQVGGFDLIYKGKKTYEPGQVCLLGCKNNREVQCRKMAKEIALRLAQNARIGSTAAVTTQRATSLAPTNSSANAQARNQTRVFRRPVVAGSVNMR